MVGGGEEREGGGLERESAETMEKRNHELNQTADVCRSICDRSS